MTRGPPLPDKLVIPTHDERGRVVGASTYEGLSVSHLVNWESYIAQEIDRRVEAKLTSFARGLAREVAAIVGAAEDRMKARGDRMAASLGDRIERQEQRHYPVLPRKPMSAAS